MTEKRRAITVFVLASVIWLMVLTQKLMPQYGLAWLAIMLLALAAQITIVWPLLRDDFWLALVHLDKWLNDKWLRGRWETMSGRMQRRFLQGKCPLCGWVCAQLDRIDPGHCKRAYLNDRINHPDLPI